MSPKKKSLLGSVSVRFEPPTSPPLDPGHDTSPFKTNVICAVTELIYMLTY